MSLSCFNQLTKSKIIVINTANIDSDSVIRWVSPVDFSVRIPSKIYEVQAIKLVSLDISFNYSTNVESLPKLNTVVVRLNDINRITSPSNAIDGAYALITPTLNGTTSSSHFHFENNKMDIFHDPYSYIFSPEKASMDRIDFKLLNSDGTTYDYKGSVVSMCIMVYYKNSRIGV